MFEALTERLGSAFASLRGQRELTDQNIEEGLGAVQSALLEADVHFQVARDLVEKVRAAVVGQRALKGVDPSQQFVHAVHRSLVELMGRDKKVEGGILRFVLLEAIGRAVVRGDVAESDVRSTLVQGTAAR